MIREIMKTFEKALIMEDRIDYANYILDKMRTKEIHQEIKLLLDSEATTVNIENLQKYVVETEDEIHAFDVEALNDGCE